ncbi:hypothetical protein SAMN02745116_02621, partial [Pilibacter termitis]
MSVKIDGIEMTFDFNVEKAINKAKALKKSMAETFKGMNIGAKESSGEVEKETTKQAESVKKAYKLVRETKKKMAQEMSKSNSKEVSNKPKISIMGMDAREYVEKVRGQTSTMLEAQKNAKALVQQAQNSSESAFGKANRQFFDNSKKAWENFKETDTKEPTETKTVKMKPPKDPQPIQSLPKGMPLVNPLNQQATSQLAELERMKAKLRELAPESTRARSALSRLKLSSDLSQQTRIASNALSDLGNKASSSSSRMSRLSSVLSRAKSMMSGVASTSKRLGQNFSQSAMRFTPGAKQITSGVQGVGNSVDKMSNKIWGMVKKVFMFSLILKFIRSMRDGLSAALGTNDQFTQSLNQIKVNLLTAFYPIYTAILPLINSLMSGLAQVTGVFASFISTIFGTTYAQSKNGAAGLYDQASESADKATKKAKKFKQTLAGFDEINTLSFDDDNDEDKSGGSGVDFNKAVGDYTTPKWLADFWEDVKDIAKRIWQPILEAWKVKGAEVIRSFKYMLGEL